MCVSYYPPFCVGNSSKRNRGLSENPFKFWDKRLIKMQFFSFFQDILEAKYVVYSLSIISALIYKWAEENLMFCLLSWVYLLKNKLAQKHLCLKLYILKTLQLHNCPQIGSQESLLPFGFSFRQLRARSLLCLKV